MLWVELLDFFFRFWDAVRKVSLNASISILFVEMGWMDLETFDLAGFSETRLVKIVCMTITEKSFRSTSIFFQILIPLINSYHLRYVWALYTVDSWIPRSPWNIVTPWVHPLVAPERTRTSMGICSISKRNKTRQRTC